MKANCMSQFGTKHSAGDNREEELGVRMTGHTHFRHSLENLIILEEENGDEILPKNFSCNKHQQVTQKLNDVCISKERQVKFLPGFV